MKKEIEDLKKKFGEITELTIEGKTAYLRLPGFEEYALYQSMLSKKQGNSLVALKALLDAIFVGGSNWVICDDNILSLHVKRVDIFRLEEVQVEKLEDSKWKISLKDKAITIKKPGLEQIGIYLSNIDNPVFAGQRLFNECFVSGDRELLEGRNFISVEQAIEQVINARVSTINFL